MAKKDAAAMRFKMQSLFCYLSIKPQKEIEVGLIVL